VKCAHAYYLQKKSDFSAKLSDKNLKKKKKKK